MSDDELAFYDALETNDSAVKVLGDDTLRTIARELVATVRKNVTIDWTMRENVRAQLRVLVRRILRRYGYPPDKQEKATQTVLEQAALLSEARLPPRRPAGGETTSLFPHSDGAGSSASGLDAAHPARAGVKKLGARSADQRLGAIACVASRIAAA